MTYCAVTADCNRHELCQERDELHMDWAEQEYFDCLHDPVLRYRVDSFLRWTVDDAERLLKVLEIVLPCHYQVIQDEVFDYPDSSDTTLHLTGVEEPVLEFATEVILKTLTSRKYGEAQAKDAYNEKLGEWK